MLPPPRTLVFIINPRAGTYNKGSLPGLIKQWVLAPGLSTELHFTKAPGHATELAAQASAQGASIVVACGGDGTVNEIASALAGSETALGLLPLGSGNGLLRELGLPLNLEAALRLLINPDFRYIDAPTLNGRHFFCTAGSGFDALVALRFNQSSRRGLAGYLRLITECVSNYTPSEYIFKANGSTHTEKGFLLAVGNASQYGNNARIAPAADPSDGLLNLTLLRPFPLAYAPILGYKLLNGGIEPGRYALTETAPVFEVYRDRPGPVHFDGETAEAGHSLLFETGQKKLKTAVARIIGRHEAE